MASSRLERIGTIFTRKKSNENLFKCLSNLISQLESDHTVMKENEQKLEQLTGALNKCIQQTTAAHKQILKALKEIHDSFMKQVEGLLTRGAMKPDDRPLWFDVYKAFPPITEPKFARPKPEITEIRPILYKEDAIRAKFHKNGHGLAAVSLLNQSNETQTKRLVQQYGQLKVEGVPESEIIEKAAQAVALDRRTNYDAGQKVNTTPKNPNTVTSQVLADANIQDIFKEK